MVKAYSLISTDPGKAPQVFEEIEDMNGVESLEAVAGPYDIVSTLKAESLEKLTGTVFGKIRSTDGVSNTTTLIVVGLDE